MALAALVGRLDLLVGQETWKCKPSGRQRRRMPHGGNTQAQSAFAGAHHVHAVVEDDLSQFLPTHNAEVLLIWFVILREFCSLGALWSHAGTCQHPRELCILSRWYL